MFVRKIVIAFFMSGLLAAGVAAGEPGFNLQGKLTDSSGTVRTGTFSIAFSVYAADTGGVAIWTKTIPGVVVNNGYFQTILQGNDDNDANLENALKDLNQAYVELKVGEENAMAPRLPLIRSAFSSTNTVVGSGDVTIQSDRLGAGAGNVVVKTGGNERITVLNNGNVGINATTPDQKLTVNGSLKIVDGTQGEGRVLTSNADGKASWQFPAAGGSGSPGISLIYSHVFDGAETTLSIPVPTPRTGFYNMKFMAKIQNLTNTDNNGGYYASYSICMLPDTVSYTYGPCESFAYGDYTDSNEDSIYAVFEANFAVFDGVINFYYLTVFPTFQGSTPETGFVPFTWPLPNSTFSSLEFRFFDNYNQAFPLATSNIITPGSMVKLYKYN